MIRSRHSWSSQRPDPPRHGSSRAPFVCGGAQRGGSLATGIFTGEARRNPLGGSQTRKRQDIRCLGNHDLAKLDSFAEAREATWWKPPKPEATPTMGQPAPRECRVHRARHLHREGQARPVYLSSSPSSRAIRSPLKSPGWGVGLCIERTKNWRKSWRSAHQASNFTPCGGCTSANGRTVRVVLFPSRSVWPKATGREARIVASGVRDRLGNQKV